jgi:alkylation response protein AidB-like acyl-CoA dehydrogenase
MPDPPASGSLDTEAGWDFLAAARALTPRIAAAGEEIDAQRRLPPSLVEAMVDAGLFRMLLPRLAGGAEAPLPTFLTVVEEVARADGSCAWCLAQACVSAAAAVPYYEDGPVRQLFGDRRLVMANGTGSSGRAVAVPGGYRVTAEWPFASGCTHATWLKGVAPVYDAGGAPVQLEGGSQELRLLLFPASAGRLLDT